MTAKPLRTLLSTLSAVMSTTLGAARSPRASLRRSARAWNSSQTRSDVLSSELSYALLAAWLGLACGGYFVLRYGGHWTEWDTMTFAQILGWLQAAQGIHYPGAYDKGYAYSVWGAGLSTLSGVPVDALIQLYLPVIGNLLLAVMGFAAFRRLLASPQLGLLATSLLFLVPELIFTVSRGNHEKLTVSLTLFATFALLGALQARAEKQWHPLAIWSAIYALTTFTLMSLNSLFGSSLAAGVSLATLFAFLVLVVRPAGWRRLGLVVVHLALISLASWGVLALVVGVVYPQRWALELAQSLVDAVTSIFAPAPVEATGGAVAEATYINPYDVVNQDWVNLGLYRLVSSFRWFLLAGSFLSWCVLVVDVVKNIRTAPLPRLILASLYGAFASLLAVGVMVDFLGLEAGSNLQVRFYAYFVLFAVPTLALGVAGVLRRLSKWTSPRTSTWVRYAALSLFTVFALLSLLKATLDPVVSNRWIFYRPTEVQAVSFWNERQRSSGLWAGPSYRVINAFRHTHPSAPSNQNEISARLGSEAAAYMLDSEIFESNAVAWGVVRPTTVLENRVYDNGDAQIYHRVPRSPFQR